MFYPEVVEIHNRKTMKNLGPLSWLYINAKDGLYRVLGVINTAKQGEKPLTDLSHGKTDAIILSIKPGLLAVLQPIPEE
jgi:hypothetical protein